MASQRAGVFCLVLAVCVLDLAQSASITKVISLDLPGGEKITKREAPNPPPQAAVVREEDKAGEKKEDEEKRRGDVKLTRPVAALHKNEDREKDDISKSSSEEHVSRKPYDVNTRQRRAAAGKVEEAEDMDTAANTVFLPQFRRHLRPANRFRREVNDEAVEIFADQGEGNKRYVREAQQHADDLDTAANTVFLPQFRRRVRPNFRQF